MNVSNVFKFYRNALYIADTEAERYKKQKEMNVTTQVNIFAKSYFFNKKFWLQTLLIVCIQNAPNFSTRY